MPRKISIVNILLIANVIVYLIDQVFHLTPLFALSYFQSPYFHWFQPVTYMFMHGMVATSVFPSPVFISAILP